MGDRMMRLEGWKPGDERAFVHKRLLGGVRGAFESGVSFLTTGRPKGGGFLGGFLKPPVRSRTPVLRAPLSAEPARQIKFLDAAAGPGGALGLVGSVTRTLREFKQCMAAAGGNLQLCLAEQARLLVARRQEGNGGGGAPGCDPPLRRDPTTDLCVYPGSPVGAGAFGGEAIMGQYGAGMVAGSQIIDRATCGRGMQLGNDGVCYNKSQISNKQRMWPAGRKPLLSGGDMRAISIAARAGRRMELATKRLQKMGMMKKPVRRGGVPAGHRAKLVHASEH